MLGKEARQKNREEGKTLIVIALIIGVGPAIYIFGGFAPMHTTYEYDVKTQQVFDNDRINNSTKLSELSEDEQAILYEAFKKADHFAGSEEIHVTRSEKLDTFNQWRVVEYNGVYLLVAINGPEAQTTYSNTLPWILLFVLLSSAATLLLGLKMYVLPSNFR
jgi:hypothetical protein